MGWHKLYPLGYPVELVDTAQSVIDAAVALWGRYPQLFDAPVLSFRDVAVTQDLRSLVLTELDRRYFAPVHAACIERNGRGVLLMGDSGAGKSTLAYACVRRGWTFVSDDSTHIAPDVHTAVASLQLQNLRPDVVRFFPELSTCSVVTKSNGKLALDVPEPTYRKLTSEVAASVFLKRGDQASLQRCDIAQALAYVERYFPFPPEPWHIERLTQLFERGLWTLTYSDLDEAELQLRSKA